MSTALQLARTQRPPATATSKTSKGREHEAGMLDMALVILQLPGASG